MSGEEAYEIYKRALAERGVEIDAWEDLDEPEQEAWEVVALELTTWEPT